MLVQASEMQVYLRFHSERSQVSTKLILNFQFEKLVIPLGGLLEDVDEVSAPLFGVVLVEVVVHHTSAEGEGHEA